MKTVHTPLSTGERSSLIIASTGLILLALVIAMVMIRTAPVSKRVAPEVGAPLVECIQPQVVDHQTRIAVIGKVEASRAYSLQPRVGGEVTWISPSFMEGAQVKAGEVLLRIDQSDYELVLENALAQLEQARVALLMEEGQQEVARREWDLLGGEAAVTDSVSRALILRQPQLKSAQAVLRGAEAAVRQARLNLERCNVAALMDARILAANANPGDQVSQASVLGRLAGTGAWWLRATVSISELPWIVLPANGNPGSVVRVESSTGVLLEGHVLELQAELENSGRLATLLIEIPDALQQAAAQDLPLLLGDYLEGELLGRVLENVLIIDRDVLREGDMLWWLDSEDRLRVRPAEALWTGDTVLAVAAPDENWLLIESSLTSAIEGMQLRKELAE